VDWDGGLLCSGCQVTERLWWEEVNVPWAVDVDGEGMESEEESEEKREEEKESDGEVEAGTTDDLRVRSAVGFGMKGR